MNIKIKEIKLQNFKCFRDKSLTFESDVITLKGRNGVGKTTIADAILWCLFGKNTQGQSDFDIKTHDEKGEPIPHLDHSVELLLLINDDDTEKEVSLKRTLKEVWVKKRGAEEQTLKNNTTEYTLNGEVITAGDYKKYISSLIDEETFRCITNHTYFPSKKWQDQRDFLSKMAGEIRTEEIANTEELVSVANTLNTSGETIAEYRKHLSYKIKQIKEQLERIPIRLEEQNKALPEKANWDELKEELKTKQEELAKINEDIYAVNNGNGGDVERESIKNEINVLRAKKADIYNNVYSEYQRESKDYNDKITEYTANFNKELNNQRLMEQTIEANGKLVERCNETIKELDAELEILRSEWPTDKFELSEDVTICPTCGQLLPEDIIKDKIESLKSDFNLKKEAKKKQLNERAAKVKRDKEEAGNKITELQEKNKQDEINLQIIKGNINTIFAEKAELEKNQIPNIDDRLKDNTEYQSVLSELQEKENSLTNVATEDNSGLLSELNAKKAALSETLTGINTQLASQIQYDKITGLISGIKEEEKNLIKQLSELERDEDLARKYQDNQNAILEERINKHFNLVKWKMFKTVNNNGDPFDEPYCECYVNGSAYHDGLNQAARLNAGLDICEALCKYYQVSAPIIIDNSESCLDIIPTTGQQIRLEVYNSELTF